MGIVKKLKKKIYENHIQSKYTKFANCNKNNVYTNCCKL